MPYKASRARRECEARLATLVAAATKSSTPALDKDVRQAALQGILVQVHSALEEYFNGVFSDWISALAAARQRSGVLPARTRNWLAHAPHFEAYRFFAYSFDEKRFLDAADVARYERAYFDGSAEVPRGISGTRVIGNSSYPSFDNIKAVFARIGVDDIKGYLSKKLSFSSKLFMQSISDTRASVTHKNAPDITLSDIVEYANKIRKLVMWLDHALKEGVGVGAQASTWQAMC